MNFPNNPTGAVPTPGPGAAFSTLCDERGIRARLRRGLPRPRARRRRRRSRRPPTCPDRGLGQRDVEVIRAAGPTDRLAGHPRPRPPGPWRRQSTTPRSATRPERVAGDDRARHARAIQARNRGIVADNLPSSTPCSPPTRTSSTGEPEAAASLPPLPRRRRRGHFCRDLVETAGVLLLPADLPFALAPVPTDRFRIGVGRTTRNRHWRRSERSSLSARSSCGSATRPAAGTSR